MNHVPAAKPARLEAVLMTVDVIGWTPFDAVALVDGVRCRIRQNATETRWLCDEHPAQFDPQRQNHSNRTARRQARQETR